MIPEDRVDVTSTGKEEQMKIAWRYQNQPKVQVCSSTYLSGCLKCFFVVVVVIDFVCDIRTQYSPPSAIDLDTSLT